MPSLSYQAPVDQLLKQGLPEDIDSGQGIDYLDVFGFTEDHILELSRLASGENVNWKDDTEYYAPLHACRVLGQIKSELAIQEILKLFDNENDELREDVRKIIPKIGPDCIPVLNDYLLQSQDNWLGTDTAAGCLTNISLAYPDHRHDCIQILTDSLSRHNNQLPAVNASLVAYLLDLKAVESASVIEKAYKEGPIDESWCGSWASVQIELGLATVADFSPEELRFKGQGMLEEIYKAIKSPKRLPADPIGLISLDSLDLFLKQQQLPKKTTGFGVPKQKKKKRKKKR